MDENLVQRSSSLMETTPFLRHFPPNLLVFNFLADGESSQSDSVQFPSSGAPDLDSLFFLLRENIDIKRINDNNSKKDIKRNNGIKRNNSH